MTFTEGSHSYEIKLGDTANDFHQREYEFQRAKLRAWSKLPDEFRDVLSTTNYLERMRTYLSRVSRKKMRLNERISTLREEEEINSIWNVAIRETVLTRMEKKFPGYSQIKEDFLPLELRYESQRQRRVLISQLATAIWNKHPNWLKVQRQFERVRQAYREVISSNDELPDEIKTDWLGRIEEVKLIIPGSDPAIDMENCYKDEDNAYYFTEKNEVTVCAGDFNSEEVEQTLAHEMAHTLDLSRSRFIYQRDSLIGLSLKELKDGSCSSKGYSCEQWLNLKSKFSDLLKASQDFKPQLPDFNACLKRKATKPIPADYIERIAREEVEATVADLAERNVFLRIVSSQLPLPDGSSQPNPMHMNPCGYYLWTTNVHPLDEDVALLLFFTTEYKCSAETDKEMRFKKAIETAREMQMSLSSMRIAMEGEFSGRDRLDFDGYSSSPVERFADSIGQMVFSHLLDQDPDPSRRRARYLANNAWLCRRPSIQQLYPQEAKVQKSYYVEPHSDSSSRQAELLTESIRNSLQCSMDFDSRQCSLQ